MGAHVSFSSTLFWEIHHSINGEQDILAAVSSVDTDTFPLRVPMDSQALLAPQGQRARRSVPTLCISSQKPYY